MSKNNLTIIILSYNSSKIIGNLLSKLNAEKYEIIVVDNASKDNSVSLIKQNFPQVKLMALKQNIGYGRANNKALLEVKTDFALLLNPDVIIEEHAIDKVLEAMQKSDKIALASPVIYSCLLENNKIIQEKLVQKPNDKSVIFENDDFYFTKFITGAAMFMNMKLMRDVGFFDEGFFLYCEDNEICRRVAKKGYDKVIVKGVKFHHLSGKSSVLDEKELAKVYWHKFGWSKCYYTELMHNVFLAKLKSLAVILKALKIMLKNFLKREKIEASSKGMLRGAFGYLIGLKAFDKNGNARP